MSDYKELISELRDAEQANWKRLSLDAAAVIEQLWADNDILHQHIEVMNEVFRDKSVECQKAAKRNAELHAELERWVSAAEMAGEPKRGKWVRVENGESYHYECSRCGERPLYSRYGDIVLSGVCPMCGAKMEVQDESQNNRANRE